jgi:hypothetical protein
MVISFSVALNAWFMPKRKTICDIRNRIYEERHAQS